MTPVDVRQELVNALKLDLVGPEKGSELEEEVLPQAPSRWYLTGFLVPSEANAEQRAEETSEEEVDQMDDRGASDDAAIPEPVSAKRAFYPSSMGMSLLISPETHEITVRVCWGDYHLQSGADDGRNGEKDEGAKDANGGGSRGNAVWKRTQREALVTLQLPSSTTRPREEDVPDSKGLKLALSVRSVQVTGPAQQMIPQGTRSVSIFLVNRRRPADDEARDEAFAFQTEICVKSVIPLVPRLNLRGLQAEDWDERVADLQYRDVCEYAVGHGVATYAVISPDGQCQQVCTWWIPSAEVERVAPTPIEGVELSMEALSELVDGATAKERLGKFVTQYRSWIDAQQQNIPASPPRRKEIGEEMQRRARTAANRIEVGIALLDDPTTLEAFRIANRAMATAARRRFGTMQEKNPSTIEPPRWHPFQLAFILMNLQGIVDPQQADREVVDLLFFPTGGGKTEAYLGLAAFTLVLRRLRNPGISSAGLSVLMRYTLRLLTLDQLSRAATLICALELERQNDPKKKLGSWPFEIGLWVGKAATPNRMGKKGDNDPSCARLKTIAFLNDDRKPSPIPLEDCPWCGTKFNRNSFRLVPNPDNPIDLRVTCVNRRCDYSRDRALPILAVDEPIYRRLPCFMVATVDKFAAMPWTGQVGAFFGRVRRYDANGFYGPCEPNQGQALPSALSPPDLVIQDELHLISGPMGTLVGLYESALDELCSRDVNGRKIRPKIVASTATVRRADNQIRALFNHRAVDIFPPPGPDRRDSFFARVDTSQESNARLYLGIAAQGRSPKVMLLRTYLALLAAGQKAFDREGGKENEDNPADPYMTLVGYFNSLRELGGSRRIVEDEVSTRLSGYNKRKRVSEAEGLFASRAIQYDVVELTSRVSTDKVADAKRRLASLFRDKDRVDVALATNMISVGLDITRLGLMVVFGQPKTSAEYIQATSRVGRDYKRPGVVVTLLNIHKPRDRSHYERFGAYHQTFYRSVEATSVTPFSPRALDKGFGGTLVALARQGHEPMTPPLGATAILNERQQLDFVVEKLSQRAAAHAPLSAEDAEALRVRVRNRALDLLDEWSRIANDYRSKGVQLQYNEREIGAAQRLLYDFLDPELKTKPARHKKFRANRSMRDVEPSVNLWLKTLDDIEVDVEEGEE